MTIWDFVVLTSVDLCVVVDIGLSVVLVNILLEVPSVDLTDCPLLVVEELFRVDKLAELLLLVVISVETPVYFGVTVVVVNLLVVEVLLVLLSIDEDSIRW